MKLEEKINGCPSGAKEYFVLENNRLCLNFDRRTGTLVSAKNKLTGETCRVGGDHFIIEAGDFRVDFGATQLVSLSCKKDALEAHYEHDLLRVDVIYTLAPEHGFMEKKLFVTAGRDCGLTRIVVSEAELSMEGVQWVCYRHPNYARIEAQHKNAQIEYHTNESKRLPDMEPVRTFFGRTVAGGFFAGLEMPFDVSSVVKNRVTLAYSPSLRMKTGQRLACEPAYLGVYKRCALDARAVEWRPRDDPYDGIMPLPSESAAMVKMTSAILGPRRNFNLIAMACGWGSEMQHGEYTSDDVVEAEMKSLDFLAECGVDWVSDSHPWGGETEKMNALKEGQHYEPGPLVRRFLNHARKVGVRVVQWSSMNTTHAWSPQGKPFCADRTEWLRIPGPPTDNQRQRVEEKIRSILSNCFANTPFFNWLQTLNVDALNTGHYDGWCMDGDFWGYGGYFNTTTPVECFSEQHDHLVPDANYACQKALERLTAAVRRKQPGILILMCRPPMDLGVWSQREVDACFTLIETGTESSNIFGGDEIRIVSRIRLHHHFFPHYIDLPLLFPSFDTVSAKSRWPSEKIDYIMLSALSCAPNLLLYLPTKTGIPTQDKAEIRKWLDWGRKNIAYLKIRKDLPDWPQPGKVDGSAHIIDDHGLIFLFNPNKKSLDAEFTLTDESIGLKCGGEFEVRPEYPEPGPDVRYAHGDLVRRQVPARSVVILRLGRAKKTN